MKYPLLIEKLIGVFKELPTVGPKTAERYVFYLLKQPTEKLQIFAQHLAELKEKTIICPECMSLSETSPCAICKDIKRDKSKLCIVATYQDLLSIDSTNRYNGLYFVLGGLIDTINNINPENLNINNLKNKIKKQTPKEIILALNPTINGEITSLYISRLYKNSNIKITKLARGLPTGSNLEYADEITLANALKNRNII